MNLPIRQCTIDDLSTLRKIACETFDETFREANAKETIDSYLADAFNEEKLTKELETDGSKFYFIYSANELAGYIKLNEAPAQSDVNDPNSLEIERIYIKKDFKGLGLGKKLINFASGLAKESRKDYLWLGVWEKNHDAISFYTKMGFQIDGLHLFKMGNEYQTDFIMKQSTSQ